MSHGGPSEDDDGSAYVSRVFSLEPETMAYLAEHVARTDCGLERVLPGSTSFHPRRVPVARCLSDEQGLSIDAWEVEEAWPLGAERRIRPRAFKPRRDFPSGGQPPPARRPPIIGIPSTMPAPPTHPTVTLAAPPARDGGLDALRAGAMLIVVLFHAAVPYVLTPLRGLVWAVSGAAQNRLLDVLFWASHAVQMPLLFFLSGFLAAPALERRKAPAFLAARLRRLGLPLLVPGLAVLVVLYYVWSAGWLLDGRCTLREVRAVKFADPTIRAGFLGPAHLWFLEELLVVTLLWAGVRLLPGTPRSGRWLVPACALGSVSLAALAPRVVTAFHNGFLPDPGRLAWHALFFLAGAASSDVEAVRRRATAHPKLLPIGLPAATALLAFAAAYPLLPSVSAGTAPALSRAAFAVAWALAAWGGVLALFACARRAGGASGPRAALLVEASFWIYLVHVPLVGAFHIALVPSALAPVAAWAAATVGALGVSLLSWLPVRNTALGDLLVGGRSRR